MSVPLVRVHHRRPSVVGPSVWRRTKPYQHYRQSTRLATTYADLVAVLEDALHDADARTSALLDFAPAADYARQFLNTTTAYKNLPTTDPRRTLGERGARVLAAILTGGGAPGRPSSPARESGEIARIRAMRLDIYRDVQRLWREAENRSAFVGAVARREKLSPSRAHALWRLRPSDVAAYLTAWKLGVPVRVVRAAMRRLPETAYA